MPSVVAQNLQRVQETIARAALQAGRNPQDVKLIAVSKGHPWPAIAAAIAAGQYLFGENTVQEALKKIPQCQDPDVEWHLIGHLQSNKAKHVAGGFAWLHSLDSVELAQRLERVCAGNRLNALVQVNLTEDPRKHGVTEAQLFHLLDELLQARPDHLQLRGLMAIGPHAAPESELRATFARLRMLGARCREQFHLPDFTELSMGMSGDFAAAILEGATFVRIGSAIFGERPVKGRG